MDLFAGHSWLYASHRVIQLSDSTAASSSPSSLYRFVRLFFFLQYAVARRGCNLPKTSIWTVQLALSTRIKAKLMNHSRWCRISQFPSAANGHRLQFCRSLTSLSVIC
ncbi:hypothetical protein Tsp_07944 [Trichinella spiralis]|uniref:hypothetical protein n=1 Tax=Trichinella spiralis TaxID=6334 RepID=UPI0001EFD6EB|nr:hypothetical protein Tsp_07944 [Trichinella spiralis]